MTIEHLAEQATIPDRTIRMSICRLILLVWVVRVLDGSNLSLLHKIRAFQSDNSHMYLVSIQQVFDHLRHSVILGHMAVFTHARAAISRFYLFRWLYYLTLGKSS